MSEASGFPLWFPVVFVGGWLLVGALLSEVSRWPELAYRFPGGERPIGKRLSGQVVSVGMVSEHNLTTLTVSPTGLYLRATFLFRFRRPPILVPWPEVRYASDGKLLWWRTYVLDLGGVTSIRVMEEAFRALEPFLVGASSAEARRTGTVT